MNHGAIVKLLHDYLSLNGHCSFAEIDRVLERAGIAYEGDYAIRFPEYEHIYVWYGWNEEMIQIMSECKFAMKSAPLLIYLMDGKVPSDPIAKQLRNYKKDRWMPVVLSLE